MKRKDLPDRNQNFWQITCIQSASQSIYGMLLGGILTKQYGSPVAFTSICIGNLFLWVIGLGVILIASKERKNAVENVQGYLGKTSSFIMTMILIIAFLSWYMLQIKDSITSITPLFQQHQLGLEIFGILLGIAIAILSMGGIRLIRMICVIAFPFLLGFLLYLIVTSNFMTTLNGTWGFSLTGIVTVSAITLPGTVNLPTFFRHSNSRADSLLALTLMTFFAIIFQSFSIFTGMTQPVDFIKDRISFDFFTIIAFIFIITSLVCVNLVNIYFASATVEAILPRLSKSIGYVIVGLLGTISYIFLQNSSIMLFIEDLTDSFIANLGISLLLSFLASMFIKHRFRVLEKSASSVCWGFGCLISMIFLIRNAENSNQALVAGIGASLLAFIILAFIEETIWSSKKVIEP
jgi:hypothetical protein